MFNSMEEYGKAWVSMRRSPSFYPLREPGDYEKGRVDGVEDFLAGWAMVQASQTLRDSKQLDEIHMNRDSSRVRG